MGENKERTKVKVIEAKSKSLFGKTQMEKAIEKYTEQGWILASKRKIRNQDKYALEFHYFMSPEEIAKEDRNKRNGYIMTAVIVLLMCSYGAFQAEVAERQQAAEQSTRIAVNNTESAYATQTATLWTLTPTFTPTLTPTLTLSPTQTLTPTLTLTPTITNTPTQTFTPSITPSPTITNTPRPTNTDSPTNTPRPTSLPSGTTYYVSATQANTRSCASTECERVVALFLNDEIEIIDTNVEGEDVLTGTRWMQGVVNGQSVFIHSSLVSRTRISTAIPVPVNNVTNSGNSSNTSSQNVAPPASSACSCGSDTYNCSSFSRQSEAQACYNQCQAERGYDVHGLDGNDNDGRACESLP